MNNIHYICIIMHIDSIGLLVYISKVEKRGKLWKEMTGKDCYDKSGNHWGYWLGRSRTCEAVDAS